MRDVQDRAAPVGVLGGTFDPIHLGHLGLARDALAELGLARVRFIPAGQPVHRGSPGATAEQRLAMTRLALAGQARFELDEAEVLSPAPSYTVPTLERLRIEFGHDCPLVLLMGVDAFAGLQAWHRWRELFDLAHVGVATRPGHVLDPASLDAGLAQEFAARRAGAEALQAGAAGRIVCFAIEPQDISATRIREQIRTGAHPGALVPEPVLDYIETHSLYRKGTA